MVHEVMVLEQTVVEEPDIQLLSYQFYALNYIFNLRSFQSVQKIKPIISSVFGYVSNKMTIKFDRYFFPHKNETVLLPF